MLKHFYHKQDDATLYIYGSTWMAQSFTPDVGFTCNGLTLFMSKLGTPTGTLTFDLYLADGSGNPTGGALATTAVDYSGIDTGTSYPGCPLKATFSPEVVLSASTQYVFVARLSAGNASNCLRITNKNVGDYAGGNCKTSVNAGGSWTDVGKDVTFDLWDQSTAGVISYFAVEVRNSATRFERIYRDGAGNSTISEVIVLAANLECRVLKSANYMYVFTSTNMNTYIRRYNPSMVYDATFGLKTFSNSLRMAAVSDDDYVAFTTSYTRGQVYLYSPSWTLLFSMDSGSTGYLFWGVAVSSTEDHFVFGGGNDSGGWLNAARRKRSDGSDRFSFWSNAMSIYPFCMRELGSHAIGAQAFGGSCTVREYHETGNSQVWTRTVSPYGGIPNDIVHYAASNLVFVGTARANSVSVFKIDGSNGNQLATFDTGSNVRAIRVTRNDTLLVCGGYGSDGGGSTCLREMDTALSVSWRFDTNFAVGLQAVIETVISYVEVVPTIEGTGTFALPSIVPGTPSDAAEDGTQPALVYRPEVPVFEHLKFLTTINRSIGGLEERIACRKVPRKDFEFKIADRRQHLESIFFTRAARKLTLPHWHEPAYLATAAIAGDGHVHVGTTALSEFRVGGFALVSRSDTKYDAVQIASVTASLVTFETGNILTHDYPINTQVLPLEPTYAADIAIDRQYDSSVYDVKFEMVPQDNDLGLTPYTDGELLLSEVNYRDGTLQESIAQSMYTVDSAQGSFEKSTIRSNSDRGMTLGWRTHSRQDLWDLRELMYRLQGMRTSFYLVTFAKDLVPVAALTNGLTRLDVVYCGYTHHVGVEREIRVVLRDGTTYSRNITAWQIISSTKERLTVDTAWSATVQVADIDRIEYRDLVRLDTDDVVIEHQNALGWAKCEVPVVRVVPPDPPESGSPLGLSLLWTME